MSTQAVSEVPGSAGFDERKLRDFSDRLSPMLVKELRQGLRSRLFLIAFIALQALLMIPLVVGSSVKNPSQTGVVLSGFLFAILSVVLLLVQPLRASTSIANEIKSGTIELMSLTRLGSWRMVLGKWSALVLQSALFVVSVIPYLLFRYILGGMDLFSEILALFLLFVASCGLTALGVGASASKTVFVRLFFTGIMVLGMLSGPPALMSALLLRSMAGGRGGGLPFDPAGAESLIWCGVFVLGVAYIAFSALSMGASLVAPAAENHSAARRLTALALLSTAIGLGFHSKVGWGISSAAASLVALPAIFLALTESAPFVETVRRPFARFGLPGRLVGWFLYPVPASGILAALVFGLLALVPFFLDWGSKGFSSSMPEELEAACSLLGGLWLAGLMQVLASRRAKEGSERIGPYLLWALVIAMLTFVFAIVFASGDVEGPATLIGVWLPPLGIWYREQGIEMADYASLSSICFTIVYFAVLLFLAVFRIHRTGPGLGSAGDDNGS